MRGHDELNRLLWRFPSVHAYIPASEIDSPDRKVIVSGGMNFEPEKFGIDRRDVAQLFSLQLPAARSSL